MNELCLPGTRVPIFSHFYNIVKNIAAIAGSG